MTQNDPSERFWKRFHGPNMGYIEEQYELYNTDSEKVDPSLKEIFSKYGAPKWLSETTGEVVEHQPAEFSSKDAEKLSAALKYVASIRRFGHIEADIYAVGNPGEKSSLLDPATYNLTDDDLRSMPASWLWEDAPYHIKTGYDNVETGYDLVQFLRERYTGKISFEFGHVNNESEREWLLNHIEASQFELKLSEEEKRQLLERLLSIEGFEHFLQSTFVGQKRFSIEGLETMVPILDQIVNLANSKGVEDIMMGMAHRGRLSVLAYVLGKPFDKIFSEFHHAPDKELIPSEGSMGINYGWTGDVAYHFGAIREVTNETKSTRVTLAHNPSHLEFVNPVVLGFTRAAQDNRSKKGYPEQDLSKAMSVLIHGDAAFIGEGIVAETFNLSDLDGYKTGGTIHLIANNLIGFTTDGKDGRSTRYASDLAKAFEIPIVRVNADDPLACVAAAKLAYDFSREFNKDFVIDLVGYRRYGHNEMDEPRSTQPILYREIDEHPTVAEIFSEQLQRENVVTEEDIKNIKTKIKDELQAVYDNMKEDELEGLPEINKPKALTGDLEKYETAVPLEELKALNAGLLERPENFNMFRRLNRIFNRRSDILEEGNKADWGEGEALTYASILQDGIPIRLTGQDSERGTFAHRHLVLYDVETGEKYCPMHGLEQANASFDIHNSPLSESGVIGFEYGYSVASPETLVIWEAQFGDFANVAQVYFDQFISSSRAKWGEISNMVMLLPHGYEGQGPEHSSARLERFLQMAGENNWIIANVTSSAQFFHLMRRQAHMKNNEDARPLVLMTPKSLLRNQRVASEAHEFTEGKFLPLRDQPGLEINRDKTTRLLLGSGKIMVDIEEAIDKSEEDFSWLRALRVEQLYPFPLEQLKEEIKQLPNLEEIVWVQEEPQNMGSWTFVLEYLRDLVDKDQTLRYIGRPVRASTSVGEPNIHRIFQDNVIQEAINPSKGGNDSEGN